MDASQRLKKPTFVQLGLINAPDLTKEYETRGWAAPGIEWGNFRTALLKVEWTDPRAAQLQVIEIKSTEMNAPQVVSFIFLRVRFVTRSILLRTRRLPARQN